MGIPANAVSLRLIWRKACINFVFDQNYCLQRFISPQMQNKIGSSMGVSVPGLLTNGGAVEFKLCV